MSSKIVGLVKTVWEAGHLSFWIYSFLLCVCVCASVLVVYFIPFLRQYAGYSVSFLCNIGSCVVCLILVSEN